MDGAEFIKMVTLVGTTAGIHEREHTGNKKGALMMGNRKRPGEDGAGLAVLTLAVGEKQRISGAVAVPEVAALADEAFPDGSIVFDRRAAADDEVIGNHSMTDAYRSKFVAGDGSVAEAARTAHYGTVSDGYTVDIPCVANSDVGAYLAYGALLAFCKSLCEGVQPG